MYKNVTRNTRKMAITAACPGARAANDAIFMTQRLASKYTITACRAKNSLGGYALSDRLLV